MVHSSKVYSNNIGQDVEIGDYAIIYENCKIGNNITIGEHSVLGRQPKPTSVIVREFENNNPVIIGDRISICANVIIYEGVRIGNDTLIGDNSSILTDVTIGESVLISRNVTINSEVTIGNNTRIMDNTHITGKVKIGNNVFISIGVSTANDNSFGANGYNENVKGPTIEDDVCIGVGATLLPDIIIGKGSIVAAGSVVTKNVPKGVMVAGVPAKIVKKL